MVLVWGREESLPGAVGVFWEAEPAAEEGLRGENRNGPSAAGAWTQVGLAGSERTRLPDGEISSAGSASALQADRKVASLWKKTKLASLNLNQGHGSKLKELG